MQKVVLHYSYIRSIDVVLPTVSIGNGLEKISIEKIE